MGTPFMILAFNIAILVLALALIWAVTVIGKLKYNLIGLELELQQQQSVNEKAKVATGTAFTDRIQELDNSNKAMEEINSNLEELLKHISNQILNPVLVIRKIVEIQKNGIQISNTHLNLIEDELIGLEYVITRLHSINTLSVAQCRYENASVDNLFNKSISRIDKDQRFTNIKIKTYSDFVFLSTDPILFDIILVNLLSMACHIIHRRGETESNQIEVLIIDNHEGFTLIVNWPLPQRWGICEDKTNQESIIHGLDLVQLAVHKLNGTILSSETNDRKGQFKIKFKNKNPQTNESNHNALLMEQAQER